MSEQAPGPGWWQASDGNWYPPEARQDPEEQPPQPGWWKASDGNWYPPESASQPQQAADAETPTPAAGAPAGGPEPVREPDAVWQTIYPDAEPPQPEAVTPPSAPEAGPGLGADAPPWAPAPAPTPTPTPT